LFLVLKASQQSESSKSSTLGQKEAEISQLKKDLEEKNSQITKVFFLSFFLSFLLNYENNK